MERQKLFVEKPIIENEKILLRPLKLSDSEALERLTKNEKIYKYLPTFLEERQYQDIQSAIKAINGKIFDEKKSIILGIVLKEEDTLCGLAEIYGFRDDIHKVSVGYRLMEEYWGRGIATETLGLMVNYLFERADIEIITASTMIENIASERVLQCNDFIKTAKRVEEDWGFEEPTVTNKWIQLSNGIMEIPIKDLENHKAFPTFMKDYLQSEHSGIEHIVTDEKV